MRRAMRLCNPLHIDEIFPKATIFVPPHVLEEAGSEIRPRGCVIKSPGVIRYQVHNQSVSDMQDVLVCFFSYVRTTIKNVFRFCIPTGHLVSGVFLCVFFAVFVGRSAGKKKVGPFEDCSPVWETNKLTVSSRI